MTRLKNEATGVIVDVSDVTAATLDGFTPADTGEDQDDTVSEPGAASDTKARPGRTSKP